MTSGGAAGNAGADFQQRVAALLTVHMLSGIEDVPAFGIGSGVYVKELRFESDDEIDDLVVVTSKGRLFVQAKRALSLSDDNESEFSSVLKQFVHQYCHDSNNDDVYILATSSRSSRKITKDLKKLTHASRLNEDGSNQNPLTRAEEEVLQKTRTLCESHYQEVTGSALDVDTYRTILSKIIVAIVDIEEGQPLEAAAITLLSGKTKVSPQIVWEALVAMCLSLAGKKVTDLLSH